MLVRLLLLAPFLALLSLASPADAQRRCVKGKPCGNTCIARDKVCRVESSGAVGRAEESRQPNADARDSLPSSEPPPPTPIGATVPCVVRRIVDGDTVDCAGGTRVRLLMIDAPERSQDPFGAMSTRALRRLVPVGTRATLELDVQPRDRYGRLLAYIYAPDGRMANEVMVREGYALLYTYPPNVRHVDRIRAAQDRARAERRGLWATSAFDCPPAAHRRRAC